MPGKNLRKLETPKFITTSILGGKVPLAVALPETISLVHNHVTIFNNYREDHYFGRSDYIFAENDHVFGFQPDELFCYFMERELHAEETQNSEEG